MTGDLSSAFGASAASRAGLDGLLPPRPRPETPTARSGERPAATIQVEPAEKAPTRPKTPPPSRGAGAGRRLRPAPAAIAQSQSYQVTVYVLPEAKLAARQRRDRDGVTNAEVAFDAIDATFTDLQELLRAQRTTERAENSLFPPRRTPRRKAKVQSRRVLWSIQATADELAVLDELMAEMGAESRSELIAAAIEAHLLTKNRR
ncbi:ribbon-helix-helix protein, CopG family [Pseudonocardia spinosispora]|uniref:ribbon-helix-helix protein, CopG family n=1 Tax=Pseudonocardia spinosispora TaxID=103441 RepID=UPI000404D5BC|nr:ribbon-helix-helix protein, CopG family [Pseudonocardia spinosispora]